MKVTVRAALCLCGADSLKVMVALCPCVVDSLKVTVRGLFIKVR